MIDDEVSRAVGKFIDANVWPKTDGRLHADMVMKRVIPYLHELGLSNRVSLNDKAELSRLVDRLLCSKYPKTESVTFKEEECEDDDICMNCGSPDSIEFERHFVGCALKNPSGYLEEYWGTSLGCSCRNGGGPSWIDILEGSFRRLPSNPV